LETTYQSPLYSSLVEIARAKDVKLGKATVLSTVDGVRVEEYDIEIVTKSNQTKRSEKGLVIKVTDKRLLEKTGGIVQGMSGSPIMQDGKLIGAVTHVFLNDPTRGFGIFAEYLSE
ncbi:MAG: SpoIVB peptidase, partial [Clostridia bacterium]|nr:SpoIVB peptidase [Clostridia bacterium]